jgi:hypothetical protein
VGDLIGHSLKVRENDIRPFTAMEAIDFFANPEAVVPFLTLSSNGHEYVGGYYMRVWYPSLVKRLPSLGEGHMNHGPFVFLAELLPPEPPFR